MAEREQQIRERAEAQAIKARWENPAQGGHSNCRVTILTLLSELAAVRGRAERAEAALRKIAAMIHPEGYEYATMNRAVTSEAANIARAALAEGASGDA